MVPLFHIALLVLFVIIIYAIIGLELLCGRFHNVCIKNETGKIYFYYFLFVTFLLTCIIFSPTGEVNDDRPICDDSLLSGHKCYPDESCIHFEKSYPNDGITNFDNIGLAMLTVFQCISMEGWTDIMYWVKKKLCDKNS